MELRRQELEREKEKRKLETEMKKKEVDDFHKYMGSHKQAEVSRLFYLVKIYWE
jgi:hypothetical protein